MGVRGGACDEVKGKGGRLSMASKQLNKSLPSQPKWKTKKERKNKSLIRGGSEHLPRLAAGNARPPIPLSSRKRKTTHSHTHSHADVSCVPPLPADDHSAATAKVLSLPDEQPQGNSYPKEIRAPTASAWVPPGPGSTDLLLPACTDLKTAHQHNNWQAANLSHAC